MKDYVNKDKYYFISEFSKPTLKKPELNRYDILEGGFTSLVYTLTDNTLHLILMYFAYKMIFPV